MAVDSQLTLFGLDLRTIPQFWRAGWRELLWAPNAYCRRWVDEVVTATFSDNDRQCYQAGEKTSPRSTKAQASVLPADMVLDMQLDLPTSVELDLDSLIALEVRSKSPFPEEDTRYGWQFERGENGRLNVDLAIVSHTLASQYLGGRISRQFEKEDKWVADQTFDVDDDDKKWLRGNLEGEEVWAMVGEQPVVIQGFGEDDRDTRYRHRMKRVLAGLLYSFLIACAMVGVMMLFKYWQLQQLDSDYVQVQQDAAEAVELRDSLAQYNARVSGINDLIAGSYNPYPQISKLSAILGDDTWLTAMNIKKGIMRLSGNADNAVALMQSLSNRSEFAAVSAPTAISRGTRGQGERFVFDITLPAINVGLIATVPMAESVEGEAAVGRDGALGNEDGSVADSDKDAVEQTVITTEPAPSAAIDPAMPLGEDR